MIVVSIVKKDFMEMLKIWKIVKIVNVMIADLKSLHVIEPVDNVNVKPILKVNDVISAR